MSFLFLVLILSSCLVDVFNCYCFGVRGVVFYINFTYV